jgi:hypothetical protein
MTEQEIISIAKYLGWNVEHTETNKRLVTFARAVHLYRMPIPLNNDQIHACFNHVEYETPHNWLLNPEPWCVEFTRSIEKCHGIGEQT